jgi:hypothetical protein
MAPALGSEHTHPMRDKNQFDKADGFGRALAGLLAGSVMAGTGCVSTVEGTHTGAIWFGNDQFEQHYARSVDQVYAAAIKVVSTDGALVSEFIPHDTTNVVHSLEARVNNCNVWIRVETVSGNPEVTDLVVQARTLDQTGNAALANQLSTEIAIQLEHMPLASRD